MLKHSLLLLSLLAISGCDSEVTTVNGEPQHIFQDYVVSYDAMDDSTTIQASLRPNAFSIEELEVVSPSFLQISNHFPPPPQGGFPYPFSYPYRISLKGKIDGSVVFRDSVGYIYTNTLNLDDVGPISLDLPSIFVKTGDSIVFIWQGNPVQEGESVWVRMLGFNNLGYIPIGTKNTNVVGDTRIVFAPGEYQYAEGDAIISIGRTKTTPLIQVSPAGGIGRVSYFNSYTIRF
jgi:hypothetical protein